MAPRPDPVATPDDTYERSFEQQLNNVDYDMLRKTFEAFDADGSGSISVEEMEQITKRMNVDMSREQIEVLLIEYDEDNSGVIEFDESGNPLFELQSAFLRFEQALRELGIDVDEIREGVEAELLEQAESGSEFSDDTDDSDPDDDEYI